MQLLIWCFRYLVMKLYYPHFLKIENTWHICMSTARTNKINLEEKYMDLTDFLWLHSGKLAPSGGPCAESYYRSKDAIFTLLALLITR